MSNVEAWATVTISVLSLMGLFIAWGQWRIEQRRLAEEQRCWEDEKLRREDEQLRRDEVLAWSTEVITAMQTLVLTTEDEGDVDEAQKARLDDIRIALSILVERGRLYFRNAEPEKFGQKRRSAYRGYRPKILDRLIVAHDVAARWPIAGERDRRKLKKIALACREAFVSLAQMEVGRAKTVAPETSKGGDGARLDYLMAMPDPASVL
ncbi:MAG: hypothetical protein KGL48_13470 [Sphingomonadales bacterium]|nr:hypothetical protein [Sphingomonadales bacterium]MDE2570207.1 hypothetical protein [Sphingomonadales bacterium]